MHQLAACLRFADTVSEILRNRTQIDICLLINLLTYLLTSTILGVPLPLPTFKHRCNNSVR